MRRLLPPDVTGTVGTGAVETGTVVGVTEGVEPDEVKKLGSQDFLGCEVPVGCEEFSDVGVFVNIFQNPSPPLCLEFPLRLEYLCIYYTKKLMFFENTTCRI